MHSRLWTQICSFKNTIVDAPLGQMPPWQNLKLLQIQSSKFHFANKDKFVYWAQSPKWETLPRIHHHNYSHSPPLNIQMPATKTALSLQYGTNPLRDLSARWWQVDFIRPFPPRDSFWWRGIDAPSRHMFAFYAWRTSPSTTHLMKCFIYWYRIPHNIALDQ